MNGYYVYYENKTIGISRAYFKYRDQAEYWIRAYQDVLIRTSLIRASDVHDTTQSAPAAMPEIEPTCHDCNDTGRTGWTRACTSCDAFAALDSPRHVRATWEHDRAEVTRYAHAALVTPERDHYGRPMYPFNADGTLNVPEVRTTR